MSSPINVRDFWLKKQASTTLKASEIQEGMKATIFKVPYVDFSWNKDGAIILPIRIKIDKAIPELVALKDKDRWQPGDHAFTHLVEAFGPDPNTWHYPIEGTFQSFTVKSRRYGERSAWFFVPSSVEQKIADTANESTAAEVDGLANDTQDEPQSEAEYNHDGTKKRHPTINMQQPMKVRSDDSTNHSMTLCTVCGESIIADTQKDIQKHYSMAHPK